MRQVPAGKEITRMTWQQAEGYINNLALILEPLKVVSIYAIPRGGLVPAVLLAHRLDVRRVACLQFAEPHVWESERSICVDDIADTGGTVAAARELFPNIKIATMIARYNTKHEPDYYGTRWQTDHWIEFPWERS